jgi:hypothetical protein
VKNWYEYQAFAFKFNLYRYTEGMFTKTPGDRRFHELLTDSAAGPEAAAAHWEWLRKVTRKGNPTWRIVLGHRPLISVSARWGVARCTLYIVCTLSAHCLPPDP